MRRVLWALLICLVSKNAFASNITLDLSVEGNGNKPVLNVKTNLPAGAILTAILVNPTDQGGTGYFAQAKASVQPNHLVQFGPFSKDGEPLAPGMYQVTVSTIGADLQPRDVQPFFGAHGEQLAGPLVQNVPGTSERLVSQRFQFSIGKDGSIADSPRDGNAIGSSQDASTIKGTCNGTLSESDGIQVLPSSGPVSTKDYWAVMKRAKASHLTLGSDGFLWTTQTLSCDSALVKTDKTTGHVRVMFSNGGSSSPVLGFSGSQIGGDGPLVFSDTVYLNDGQTLSFQSGGNGQGCHFYFADHGTFTEGWQHRLTVIECEVRVKNSAGKLISGNVKFEATQSTSSSNGIGSAMKLSEIANRLTGITTPFGGVPWQPTELEIEVARCTTRVKWRFPHIASAPLWISGGSSARSWAASKTTPNWPQVCGQFERLAGNFGNVSERMARKESGT